VFSVVKLPSSPIPARQPLILPINSHVNGPDYILDIDGLAAPQDRDASSQQGASAGNLSRGRPWLAVHWKCCGAYSRVYRNRQATAYTGACPRCAKPLNVPIGPNGTDCRFFEAF